MMVDITPLLDDDYAVLLSARFTMMVTLLFVGQRRLLLIVARCRYVTEVLMPRASRRCDTDQFRAVTFPPRQR